MKLRTSGPLPAVAALVFVGAIAGVFLLLSGDDRPLDRVPLIGSAWQIASINGSPTSDDQQPTLRFEANSGGVLETPCRSIRLMWSVDTDGAAISFGEESVEERSCTAAQSAQDGQLRAALAKVTTWRVMTDDSIELFAAGGGTTIGLDRLGATGA